MDKQKLTRQLELLHKELSSCDKRCKKISKAIGIEPNDLIQYAMNETQAVLDYIKELKEGSKAAKEK